MMLVWSTLVHNPRCLYSGCRLVAQMWFWKPERLAVGRGCTSFQAMILQTITRRGYLGAAHLTVAYITGENLLMHADLDKSADIIHMHAKLE